MEPRQYTARQRGIKLGRIPFIVKLCTLLAVAVLGLNTVVVWRVGLYPATTSPVATAAIPVELDKPVVWVYAKAVSYYMTNMVWCVPIVLVCLCLHTLPFF